MSEYRFTASNSYRGHSDDEPAEGDVPEAIRGYDWHHAFMAATQAGVDRKDVAEVLHFVVGDNDGPDWVGIFRLKDGRFLYVSAGCDYTWWDCQSSGVADLRDTLDAVVRELCTDDDRVRLGLVLAGGAP